MTRTPDGDAVKSRTNLTLDRHVKANALTRLDGSRSLSAEVERLLVAEARVGSLTVIAKMDGSWATIEGPLDSIAPKDALALTGMIRDLQSGARKFLTLPPEFGVEFHRARPPERHGAIWVTADGDATCPT